MADKPETKRNGWLGWIDRRTGLVELTEHEVLTKNSPKHRAWYDYTGCFGGMALVFFIVQILSGMFLLVYYVPYADVTFEVDGATVEEILEYLQGLPQDMAEEFRSL